MVNRKDMTCKQRIANATTKMLVLVCIFTITIYVYGSIRLRWLKFPDKEFASVDHELDNEIRKQVDEVFNKHLNLFSGKSTDKEHEVATTALPSSSDRPENKASESHTTEVPKKSIQATTAPETTTAVNEITTGYTMVYDETTKQENEVTEENQFETTGEPDTAFEITKAASKTSEHKIPKIVKMKKLPVVKIRKEVDNTAKRKVETNSDPFNALVQIANPSTSGRDKLRGEVGNIFTKRRNKLRKFCGNRKGWIWLDTMQMLAVPERNFVVCTVQKAGSTSWHKLVHEMRFPDQEWDGLRKQNWKYATELDTSTRNRLTHSSKVVRAITVRHPFARLVSAWNNKFHKNFVEQNGNKMINSMPGLNKYVQKHKPDKDHVIAFEDLAQYIADVGLNEVDVHLKSIDELCNPCLFPYDYVIKAETAPEDSWFVTEKMNATLNDFSRHLPTLENSVPISSTTTAEARQADEARVISRLFRKVPRATTRMLMELYTDDFTAFGYTFDISTLEVGGFD